ncbi:uncharacterized protein APUU_11464A [Aspergillus puulaauensis]|uniref:Phosphatidate phosphatase APP1 catalytic domain-containing protein n=1 Tax=Aspergillus puulaauensis TaxID=1220207 RepID=A0A7R7XCB5_9EURO|nr:uncharacterized protein APUU_11464A [Aspergillus puulaauensis]BCS18636.1 hypothetical protein APUU_11464A [Aspergillus puulaauensis]
MSDYGSPSSWGSGYGSGTRRKKVFDYFKAANELRQSYAASWTAQRNAARDFDEEYLNTPGAFPDVEIARAGGEEMVIFPSYARRLDPERIAEMKRQKEQQQQQRDSIDSIDEYHGLDGAEEHDMQEWNIFDSANAVVAVDVRGWAYAPYRGPMTRKQRLVVALARRLSGVPAPSNNETGDGSNQDEERLPRMTEKREEEIVNTEAQSIIRNADKGNELNLKEASDTLEDSVPGRSPQRTPTTASVQSTQSTQSQLSKDELSIANANLMQRIRPFLSSPKAGMAVTVFFFNDEESQSKNILTNESGHFSVRASLSFVPTHVRVLASEDLSGVKEIEIIEPRGISMISDIDDTVKHSAIANGAKEMCRNVFVRDLSELTIDGVTDWYTELAKLGVDIHYVSNSPWQLYPLLDRFFKMVGLPPGSFHLKQYSGMLQGIFEPTAERKKGALEQILGDFPDRKFILVGDSGEADLEVYTDIVMANPGRILGVFIRDITTSERATFFEKSVKEHTPSRMRSTPELVDRTDSAPNRPTLPPRPPRTSSDPALETKSAQSDDLIDLSDETQKPQNLRAPPTVPSKPSSLRSVTNTTDVTEGPREAVKRKPAPPLPRRRGGDSDSLSPGEPASGRSSPGDTGPGSKQAPPPPPPRRSNTGASSIGPTSQTSANANRSAPDRQPFRTSTTPSSRSSSPGNASLYPPPPRTLRSSGSNSSLNKTSTNNSESYPSSRTSTMNSATPRIPLGNKREELWRRRWERASEILGDKGVVLGSWRVGTDAKDVSLWLVKEAMKETPTGKEKMKEAEKESRQEVSGNGL